MAIKWKSTDLNVKLEITHLREVGSSSKSKTGRWNKLTSVTLFIILKKIKHGTLYCIGDFLSRNTHIYLILQLSITFTPLHVCMV
jgi:hypothetical protein